MPVCWQIDTEGVELSVLRGAIRTLSCTKLVVWECGHFRDHHGGMQAAVEMLDAAGFETLMV